MAGSYECENGPPVYVQCREQLKEDGRRGDEQLPPVKRTQAGNWFVLHTRYGSENSFSDNLSSLL